MNKEVLVRAQIIKDHDGLPMVSIKYKRMSPRGEEPEIEVIFAIHWPEDYTLRTTCTLLLLSVTRTDTREPDTLSREERPEVMDSAIKAAEVYQARLVKGD